MEEHTVSGRNGSELPTYRRGQRVWVAGTLLY
jgi:hypothetical protein